MVDWLLRRSLSLPGRLLQNMEARAKMEQCMLGEHARLHPSSHLVNLQHARDRLCIGARTHVMGELMVQAHGGMIVLGEDCFIGEHTRIWSADSVHIGNRVLLSHNVNVHDFDAHSTSAAKRFEHVHRILTVGHPETVEDVAHAPVVIEDDAWIGFNASVLKGVTIGRGAIVGASSVVTHSVPEFAIVAGNPARIIGQASA